VEGRRGKKEAEKKVEVKEDWRRVCEKKILKKKKKL
jgi:hypothetical protein